MRGRKKERKKNYEVWSERKKRKGGRKQGGG